MTQHTERDASVGLPEDDPSGLAKRVGYLLDYLDAGLVELRWTGDQFNQPHTLANLDALRAAHSKATGG
jgi:hypothetical protein